MKSRKIHTHPKNTTALFRGQAGKAGSTLSPPGAWRRVTPSNTVQFWLGGADDGYYQTCSGRDCWSDVANPAVARERAVKQKRECRHVSWSRQLIYTNTPWGCIVSIRADEMTKMNRPPLTCR